MNTSNYLYYHGEQELHGYLAFNEEIQKPCPAVLIVHDWSGRNQFACKQAEMIAELGYVGFAIDMYGQGRTGKNKDEKMGLMQPLAADRPLLRERIQAAFDAVVGMSEVDPTKIAVMGFCFGGLCALDLARSGADLKGVVSFHGLLNKPPEIPNAEILAKILVLHGYDDPMVSPEDVNDFCQEMSAQKIDWQVQMFSNTMHGFTNPEARDPKFGTVYNPCVSQRAFQSMEKFLKEILV